MSDAVDDDVAGRRRRLAVILGIAAVAIIGYASLLVFSNVRVADRAAGIRERSEALILPETSTVFDPLGPSDFEVAILSGLDVSPSELSLVQNEAGICVRIEITWVLATRELDFLVATDRRLVSVDDC